MQALPVLGLKIPDDISLISIDDISIARYVTPGLTTVTFEKREMGETAVKLLIKKMGGEDVQSVIFKSDKIIERDSVLDIN